MRRWLPLAAAIALVLAFFWFNRTAWDGFFQDDELDNVAWARYVGARDYISALLKPFFDPSNFRPVGHLYFTAMSRMYGMDFPPYMTPVLLAHLVNCALLFALVRKLGVEVWQSLAAAAFFGFSAAAMDAYWKPMYVFDLFCTTFCLASILLFAYRRWVLSFVAFWLAYKAKELAVMLPVALLAYEIWLGRRRFVVLLPFFAAALSFGVQGILLNPNKNNDYTLRFTLEALQTTVPFYAGRLLAFRWSGLLLLPLLLLRDRRISFALLAMGCFLFTLLFLPGRLFTAYFYLPLACASIAIAVWFARMRPAVVWGFLALWFVFNARDLRHQQRKKLALDDEVYAFVTPLQSWAAAHPNAGTLVYENVPEGFHNWGTSAAWNIGHHSLGMRALYKGTPEAVAVLAKERVALAFWDPALHKLTIQIHSPQ